MFCILYCGNKVDGIGRRDLSCENLSDKYVYKFYLIREVGKVC